ncbi:MAG: hypothetical protein Q7S65_03225 [Nanoarchaeota archaeon]|nr:hypothetical protein [Nanoarchaeota archaeon]
MDVKTHLAALEKSEEFSSWKKEHPKSFLAHVFRMLDGVQDPIWQFGYYNENDTMTTFFLTKEAVTIEAEQEIMKANPIKEVQLSELQAGFGMALEAATAFQKEKYPKHEPLKTIAVLQVISEKLVYNITFITQKFDTLNLRVSAKEGTVIQDKLTALADMMRTFKPEDKPDYVG